MKIQELLNELEKQKLELVAGDKIMLGAIKKVVLSAVYFDGTIRKNADPDSQKNFALAIASRQGATDEEIGSALRASLAGVQLLETGFKELSKFAVEEIESRKKINESR